MKILIIGSKDRYDIFDPEIEYSYKRDYKTADMYMLTPEAAAKWTYTR